ncbi:PREDICTED: zinc finger protein 699-like isoform X2 [Bactrocera latifrons]|uniref:Zinc finger protein weckle n=2 Tax=Bactrocera latifrons TaxID=174628 RepID=A0A0K8VWB0_BACLA|nr:PREDICTED: zinc finger protein 699-like isoform X2 [Bactrocera latifrons]
MDFEWSIWCRFCAKSDIKNINIFSAKATKNNKINMISAINKFFNIKFNHKEKMPQVVCAECLLVLTSLVKFATRVCKIQEMYKEILQSEGTAVDIKFLFEKYQVNQDVSQLVNKLSENASPCNSAPIINTQASTFSNVIVYEPHADVLDSNHNTKYYCKDPLDETCECESSGSSNIFSTFEDVVAATKKSDEMSIENTDDKKLTKVECLSSENTPENNLIFPVKESLNECKYICKHCPKRFQRFSSFRLHVKKKHGLIIPLEDTTFPCPNCDLIFHRKGLMTQHLKSVHAHKTALICEKCGEIMGSKDTLRDHMHTHSNYAPFECKVCGKCFKQKTRLMKHMDIHGAKHICVECGLQLSSRATLYSHSFVHSDVMPHKCDYCGRAFKRSKTLKNHLILHTGLKPYSCDFCNKTFSNGTSCRTHKKHVHPFEFAVQEASGEKPIKAKNIPTLSVLKAV